MKKNNAMVRCMASPLWQCIFVTFLFVGCLNEIEYEEEWLDSDLFQDTTLGFDSATFVVSKQSNPDINKHVIIAVHGFTASTFEWLEFFEHAEKRPELNTLVSLVLLGGHGRDVESFESSTWEAWGKPISDEYEALVEKGFTDISFAVTSTAGTLLLELIDKDVFDSLPPKWLFFIDPLVTPTDKRLSIVQWVGPVLGNLPAGNNEEEKRYWYTNRPVDAFRELKSLTGQVQEKLQRGIHLPDSTRGVIWKAKKDKTSDPVSGFIIHKGLRDSDGKRVPLEMVDSRKHVFTRLRLRDSSPEDSLLQTRAFEVMLRAVTEDTLLTLKKSSEQEVELDSVTVSVDDSSQTFDALGNDEPINN